MNEKLEWQNSKNRTSFHRYLTQVINIVVYIHIYIYIYIYKQIVSAPQTIREH